MEVIEGKLTNLQHELLKIFSRQLNEEELREVRNLLARHFASKASNEMEKIWKERGYSEETIKGWLNEHMRTPRK
ncbi:MAG TPA: hypothetical protein VE978_24200 [Chitinophagales bacterium]|nr:hypothetical protein [Chitinophagales bacterium]